jgi:hypothetical protein
VVLKNSQLQISRVVVSYLENELALLSEVYSTVKFDPDPDTPVLKENHFFKC